MKRIKWNNDKPATEKQLAYAKSIVSRYKGKTAPLSLVRNDSLKLFVTLFWDVFELPEDLTFTEATNLIDDLKYIDPESPSLINNMFAALLKRLEGGQLTSGTKGIMIVSVCPKATEIAVEALREQKPDIYEAAMSVAEARKEKE